MSSPTTQSPLDFKLYNSLSNNVEHFVPIEAGAVRMYVCGPTVYDHAHLGHARCYITWDVLNRYLRWSGFDVTYARNVTDVDDKILKRAEEQGVSPDEVARVNYLSFTEDMTALNCLPPDKEPRATEHIEAMIEGIQALISNEMAYETPDGSVYFRTSAKADYGKLSKKPLDELRSGARVDVDPNKESPLDFALWKSVSEEEQNQEGHWFASPWGSANKGRPGWHMECSAMNKAIFGDSIDIHAGGADLVFPHHENEIAQSECWTGAVPFSKYWMHNGFVNVSGEKMSKSLGNFSTIKSLMSRYDANTIRYFLLTNHYRMPVDFQEEALNAAENWVRSRSKILKEACQVQTCETEYCADRVMSLDAFHEFVTDSSALLMQWQLAMADDMNTAKALSVLNEGLSQLKSNPSDSKALDAVLTMLSVMGYSIAGFLADDTPALDVDAISTMYQTLMRETSQPEENLNTGDVEAMVQHLIDLRLLARTDKNWALSDGIRDHLLSVGIQLMDSKAGPTKWQVMNNPAKANV